MHLTQKGNEEEIKDLLPSLLIDLWITRSISTKVCQSRVVFIDHILICSILWLKDSVCQTTWNTSCEPRVGIGKKEQLIESSCVCVWVHSWIFFFTSFFLRRIPVRRQNLYNEDDTSFRLRLDSSQWEKRAWLTCHTNSMTSQGDVYVSILCLSLSLSFSMCLRCYTCERKYIQVHSRV